MIAYFRHNTSGCICRQSDEAHSALQLLEILTKMSLVVAKINKVSIHPCFLASCKLYLLLLHIANVIRCSFSLWFAVVLIFLLVSTPHPLTLSSSICSCSQSGDKSRF